MSPSIKFNEVKKGIYCCFDNSSELISDAELLFLHKRYPRAYCLAQLSLEEIGKAMMLYDLYNELLLGKRNEFDFKDFRRKFRSHKWKTFKGKKIGLRMFNVENDTELNHSVINLVSEINQNGKGHYDALKNNSLYVSILNDKFSKPIDLYNESTVSELLKEVKEKVKFIISQTDERIKQGESFGVDSEGIIPALEEEV